MSATAPAGDPPRGSTYYPGYPGYNTGDFPQYQPGYWGDPPTTAPAPWVIPSPGVWQPNYVYTIKTLHACNCMGNCWGCGRCKCMCSCTDDTARKQQERWEREFNHIGGFDFREDLPFGPVVGEERPLRAEDV